MTLDKPVDKTTAATGGSSAIGTSATARTDTGTPSADEDPTGPAATLRMHHYQRAGQARQIKNELDNLEAYGTGDSERARKLRRTLDELGVDPDAPAADASGAPAGRATRSAGMVRSDASGPSASPARPDLTPGVSVPLAGSAKVTTTTDVTTKPAGPASGTPAGK